MWWGIGWALVALVGVFSLMPKPPEVPGDPGNWSGHLMAYGALGAWFARLLLQGRERLRAALLLIGMGVLMEVLQGLSGYRTFDLLDMFANTCGVLLGMLAAPPRLPSGLPMLERWLLRLGF
ncbi:VanZ family protein [Niveibacterium sp. 24ML]|uniref:VanZ family protein n=1 Tax=Niveibacterium sp. 24ML TaxID=2985512 RepID=UPI00226DD6E3|nr:VanZ family protein [Niveibacterium sp. 24ML]MCX9155738.1 VanZ family protein [Niveibacterium sp. 24ML]